MITDNDDQEKKQHKVVMVKVQCNESAMYSMKIKQLLNILSSSLASNFYCTLEIFIGCGEWSFKHFNACEVSD